MKLYIGGYAQGKLNYILKQTNISPDRVFDAAMAADDIIPEDTRILNRFHAWVRRCLLEGRNPEKETASMIFRNPQIIIISDEVGNGIVPMDAFEREYRERLGRILCDLAEKAERVERILCGIGQRIK